jgi:hypothetical protein
MSLETNMDRTRFDGLSDNLRRLFSTPSLMNREDPDVYAELYARVEEVVQPQDVWDQMMITDVTNHFWEQQRYRRCTGTVINSKRRAALKKILHGAIGLNDVDTETAADTYFEVARLEEREVTDYSTQVRVPKTRAGVVALMEEHGFVESISTGSPWRRPPIFSPASKILFSSTRSGGRLSCGNWNAGAKNVRSN